jgi:putative ABC transport system permease protein
MGFFFEIFRLGIRNLGLHKLRSTLTSLGIILGVAAVIVVVAVGEGNKISALREVSALGATNIIVRSSKPPEAANAGQARTFFVAYGLLRQDLLRLNSSLPDATAVVPLKAVGSDVSYENQRITSQVFGSTPKLLDVARLHLEPRGRYLSDEDLVARAPVCVVGSEIAKQFFRMRDPIGATIKITTQSFASSACLSRLVLPAAAVPLWSGATSTRTSISRSRPRKVSSATWSCVGNRALSAANRSNCPSSTLLRPTPIRSCQSPSACVAWSTRDIPGFPMCKSWCPGNCSKMRSGR